MIQAFVFVSSGLIVFTSTLAILSVIRYCPEINRLAAKRALFLRPFSR